jgi:hypothetical protein
MASCNIYLRILALDFKFTKNLQHSDIIYLSLVSVYTDLTNTTTLLEIVFIIALILFEKMLSKASVVQNYFQKKTLSSRIVGKEIQPEYQWKVILTHKRAHSVLIKK